MTSGYPLVSLGQAIRQRKQFIEIDDLQTYKRCRVQLHAQGIVLRDAVQGAEIKTKQQQVCRKGEFLVAEIDAKVGGFGIVPDSLDGAVVSSHYFLFEIDEKVLDSRFLSYFIRTPAFQHQVAAQGSTNYAAIRPRDVLEYVVPLPPLDEQRRIVARIEELAAKIEEARRLRRYIEEGLSGLITSLHLQQSGSRVVSLSDLLVLDERKVPVELGRQYPQVGIRSFGQGLFQREAVEGSQTTYAAFNELYQGAVVLSQVKGWEGAVAVCGPDYVGQYASPEYRTFRCIPEEVSPEYIAALVAIPWFWSLLKTATRGVGARRERTRPEQFLRLQLPMPPLDAQRRAGSILERLAAARSLQARGAPELDALLPTILNEAFNGRL